MEYGFLTWLSADFQYPENTSRVLPMQVLSMAHGLTSLPYLNTPLRSQMYNQGNTYERRISVHFLGSNATEISCKPLEFRPRQFKLVFPPFICTYICVPQGKSLISCLFSLYFRFLPVRQHSQKKKKKKKKGKLFSTPVFCEDLLLIQFFALPPRVLCFPRRTARHQLR